MATFYPRPLLLALAFLLAAPGLKAQNEDARELPRITELGIPMSAAFDLLQSNPSMVLRPGAIHDFKVDWSFQSWRLRPNLAVQAQPVWEIFYNRPDLARYRRASPLMRMLSTLDLSAGTVETDELQRRVALAAKITLYQERDPLLDTMLTYRAYQDYAEQKTALGEQKRELQALNDTLPASSDYLEARLAARQQLLDIEQALRALDVQYKENLAALTTLYLQEHWNLSSLDMAVGRAFTYDDSAGLDSLVLRGDALAIWVNGGLGIGRNMMLGGLLRLSISQVPDGPTTTDVFAGMNFRYGNPRFNFFAECLLGQGLSPRGGWVLAAGGDWRFSRNVVLSYGVRTFMDDGFELRQLVPVASISCMMR